jgi:hypothetical protein
MTFFELRVLEHYLMTSFDITKMKSSRWKKNIHCTRILLEQFFEQLLRMSNRWNAAVVVGGAPLIFNDGKNFRVDQFENLYSKINLP